MQSWWNRIGHKSNLAPPKFVLFISTCKIVGIFFSNGYFYRYVKIPYKNGTSHRRKYPSLSLKEKREEGNGIWEAFTQDLHVKCWQDVTHEWRVRMTYEREFLALVGWLDVSLSHEDPEMIHFFWVKIKGAYIHYPLQQKWVVACVSDTIQCQSHSLLSKLSSFLTLLDLHN